MDVLSWTRARAFSPGCLGKHQPRLEHKEVVRHGKVHRRFARMPDGSAAPPHAPRFLRPCRNRHRGLETAKVRRSPGVSGDYAPVGDELRRVGIAATEISSKIRHPSALAVRFAVVIVVVIDAVLVVAITALPW